jgi:mitogen-activated protein kinase organizer 1
MLWDMRSQTRDPLQTLKEATSSITSLTIPPGSVEIIAGSADGHVRAYDMRMGKVFEDCIGREVRLVT